MIQRFFVLIPIVYPYQNPGNTDIGTNEHLCQAQARKSCSEIVKLKSCSEVEYHFLGKKNPGNEVIISPFNWRNYFTNQNKAFLCMGFLFTFLLNSARSLVPCALEWSCTSSKTLILEWPCTHSGRESGGTFFIVKDFHLS